ncbi:Aste57867_25226 [Aphanomyces stellatus]|uniref:COMM domain-containing protein 3 n=1 Tax=Aphanomyces stellatus TaxID=120398 RepID=A0A485LSM9_9STRA|nr:hypothetical protein As57867_025148 [Aphanomyces stellatus]VFU01853.1 Aste57867_25226 [Aphanomyces stellatus]
MTLGSAVEAQVQEAAAALPTPLLTELFTLATHQLAKEDAPSPSLSTLANATTDQACAIKEAYTAICIFVAELAKQNMSKESSRRWLVELGFAEESISVLGDILDRTIPQVRALESVSGLELDQIVDVSWRLDHCIRSTTYGNIREPLYFVVLVTRSRATGLLSPKQFTCTIAQLEELVYKLQEALLQIEKVTAAFGEDDPLV